MTVIDRIQNNYDIGLINQDKYNENIQKIDELLSSIDKLPYPIPFVHPINLLSKSIFRHLFITYISFFKTASSFVNIVLNFITPSLSIY